MTSATPPALPPGPRSPSLWQLLRYAHAPLRFLEQCRARHGDAFTVRLYGYGSLVVLAEPKAVRDVFHASPDELHSGEGNEFLSIAVGSSSVLVLDGAAHGEQRRVLMPPLKGERMRAFFPAMRLETQARLREWTPGQRILLLPALRRITLRVILRAVLGLEPGAELDALETAVERMSAAGRASRYSIALLALLPARRLVGSRLLPFARHLRALDEALSDLIARRRAALGARRAENVLDDLLEARHADGTQLGPRELRDAVVTLLVAGFDTTSVALSWVLEQVLLRPELVERLRAEIASVTGGGELGDAHVAQLALLEATLKEALRVRTMIPFVVRKTMRPFVAGGREHPAGVLLAPCSHLVHRRDDLYPDAARFAPERFLERRFGPHEWFPFGGGSRVCLGMTFALHEMKVVLAGLLAGAELRLAEPGASRPVREGIILAPHDGVPAFVGARGASAAASPASLAATR